MCVIVLMAIKWQVKAALQLAWGFLFHGEDDVLNDSGIRRQFIGLIVAFAKFGLYKML